MRTKLLLATALAMVASLLAVPTSVSAATPEECAGRANSTVALLTECVTLEAVRAHQAAFQAAADNHGGTREASSPGYDASVDHVVDALTAAGYEPTVQVFPYDFFEEVGPSTLEQIDPDAVTYVDGEDFDTMSFSPSGDVTGEAVGVDLALNDPASSSSGCEIEDFEGFPAGSIALMQRGACSFAQKAQNAEASGAIGALIFNQGNTEARSLLLFGTLGAPGVGIPTFGLSTPVGAALQGTTVRMTADTISEVRQSKNVLADSAGDSDNVIVVGAHLDSVAEGPGVQDNGSGSGAILEVAIQMANVETNNTVRFAWWGAEESGLVGSTYYVNNLSEVELNEIKLNLNFDMIGSPNFARFIYDGDGDAFGLVGPPGSAAVETFFEDWYDGQGLASEPTAFSGRSDYQAFINNGIPAGGLFTGAEGIKTEEQVALYGGTAGEQYDQCYHLACDTFDNISLEVLDQNSDAVAAAVITYAQDLSSITDNQIAMITGDAGNLPGPDAAMVSVLTAAGYDVLPIDDDAVTDAGDFIDFYAESILVSSSVVPSKVSADAVMRGLPLLNLEGFLSDDFGLATRSGEQTTGKKTIVMDAANATHPLAARLTGHQSVFSSVQEKRNFGEVGDDAIVIARTTGRPKQATYYAYEYGSTMADGTQANARAVAHFPTYSGPSALSEAGAQLFLASVDWVMTSPQP